MYDSNRAQLNLTRFNFILFVYVYFLPFLPKHTHILVKDRIHQYKSEIFPLTFVLFYPRRNENSGSTYHICSTFDSLQVINWLIINYNFSRIARVYVEYCWTRFIICSRFRSFSLELCFTILWIDDTTIRVPWTKKIEESSTFLTNVQYQIEGNTSSYWITAEYSRNIGGYTASTQL